LSTAGGHPVVKAQRVSESNSWSSCEARIVSVYRINNGSCHGVRVLELKMAFALEHSFISKPT